MFRRIFFLIVVLLLTGGAAPAQTVGQTPAQTAAATLLNRWLESFNSGDGGRLLSFWSTYGSGEPNAQVSRDLGLYGMTGGFTAIKILENTGSKLSVSMKDGHGGFAEITLEVGSTVPPMIKSITGHPVPPPKPERSPAANDQELSRETGAHAAELVSKGEFSGTVFIAQADTPVFQQAWGFAQRDRKIVNSIDTQFCIGSMTKMFTAVAVLQLVEAHKLSLDGVVVDYWPDYPNHDLAARVKIRELLNHTAGTGDIFTAEYEARRSTTRTLADYVKLFGARPVEFKPGTKFEYSNYGYILLGRLIEIASGEDYFSYVQKHIIAPAGMLRTDLRAGKDVAEGYTKAGGGVQTNASTLPVAGTSAGGGYSTAGDLFLFSKALREGTLLGQRLLKEAISDQTGHGYGYGFNVSADGSFGHGGGAPGINGEMRVLANGYTVVVLSNLDPPSATEMANFITARLPAGPM